MAKKLQSFSIKKVKHTVNAKDATAEQFKKFVVDKGLEVLDCEMITKFQGARTNSFKVTVDSKDYDKSQNPQFWPYRVGIRFFKHFRENMDWSNQSNQTLAGNGTGVPSQNVPSQNVPNSSVVSNIPSQPVILSTNNRFEGLPSNVSA